MVGKRRYLQRALNERPLREVARVPSLTSNRELLIKVSAEPPGFFVSG